MVSHRLAGMTMLEQILSKKALTALGRVRTQRGIRSRTKALEVILLEAAGETPFESVTPEERAVIDDRLREVARGEVVPAEEVYAALDRRLT
jgi:predicted transcriptional regulator